MAFLSSLNISNKLLNMGGGSWNLRIYSQSVTHVSDSGNFDQHLRVWAILRDGALILWCLGRLCGFSVRSQLTLGCPVGVGNWLLLAEIHMFGVRDKMQTHSFLPFVSGVRLSHRGRYYVEQSTQNPFPVSAVSESWTKSYLIKCVVTCHDPNTQIFCVLGQVICSVLTWTTDQVTWVFWKD